MLVMLTAIAIVQADPSTDADKMTSVWKEYYAETAASYELGLEGKTPQPLKFKVESIFQYTNPERARGQHGAVFVWTRRGRPEVIGTLWSIRHRGDPTKRRTALELHSTSQSPVRFRHPPNAIRDNGKLPKWQPASPGVTWEKLKDVPRVARSKASQMIQLRRLAKSFSAAMVDADGGEQKLRLLPSPIMRYSSDEYEVLDGAIFAMVMGTDPELLVIVELRGTVDKATWHYTPVRLTGRPLRLMLDNREVWRIEKARTWDAESPYLFCLGVNDVDATNPTNEK